jgi:hypothetical protein
MLFASWYVLGADLVNWPKEARALRETQRAKKLTMERALRLLVSAYNEFIFVCEDSRRNSNGDIDDAVGCEELTLQKI